MAAASDRACSTQQHKSSSTSRTQQQQLVSAMVKQGFIPESLFSPSRLNSLSPPPSFRAPNSPSRSPTLFEMMAIEQAREPKPPSEAYKKLQERVSTVLGNAPFRISNQWGAGDVTVTVTDCW